MTYPADLIAHRKEDNQEQPLSEHAKGVARWCAQFMRQAGLPELAPLAGLLGQLHDIGKAQPAFQRYIRGASAGKEPHSAPGALLACSLLHELQVKLPLSKRLVRTAQLLAYAISGHHRGLYDYVGLQSICDKADTKDRCEKTLEALPQVRPYVKAWIQKHGEATERYLQQLADGFRAQSIIRLLFSCLVDADFLDTEAFMDIERGDRRSQATEGYASLSELRDRLQEHTDGFKADTPVNEARRHFLNACREHGRTCERGFYSLFLPTGGGKTLSSMAWALETALHHGAQRIIYVIPYTSIITQTAGIFRSIFGEANVLEHHSDVSFIGSSEADERESYDRTRLLAENWDAPIIVTTNVQFFESLFSHKVSRSRKVHHVAGSVVVFDEVQMFPTEFLNPMLRFIEDLSLVYGTQLLFCSATIPSFDKDHNSRYSYRQNFYALPSLQEVVPIVPEHFKPFERVIYHLKEQTQTIAELASTLREYPSALCVVNSRRDAARLYQELLNQGAKAEDVVHLSRNMCSAHLKERLAEVRERLKAGVPTLVVSTQLIEAGVDIDLPVVFRAMSGLDSIIQAGGRCNREGRLDRPGEVFVFSLSDGSQPFGAIAQGQEATRHLQENNKIDLDQTSMTPEQIGAYYARYYGSVGEFDLSKVSDDLYEAGACKRWQIDFQTASEKVKLIDDEGQYDLFVPYKEGKKLLDAIREYPQYLNRRQMRQLQRYHITISQRRMSELHQAGLVSAIEIKEDKPSDRMLWALVPEAYDEALGILPDNPFLAEPLIG